MACSDVDEVLFRHDDGRAVHFYMPPCTERGKLTPIIVARGGTISSKVLPGCIRLAASNQRVYSGDLVKTKYVADCVKNGTLLDVEGYRLAAGSNAPSTDDGVVSDISSEEEATIMRCTKRATQGRTKYLYSEDVKIMRYILDEQVYRETNGNAVWQTMAALKIVNHPWQSIRDRFLRQILPRIKSYSLTHREVALLTKSHVTQDDAQSGSNSPRRSPTKQLGKSSPRQGKSKPSKVAGTSEDFTNSKLHPAHDIEFDELDLELLDNMEDDIADPKLPDSHITISSTESQSQLGAVVGKQVASVGTVSPLRKPEEPTDKAISPVTTQLRVTRNLCPQIESPEKEMSPVVRLKRLNEKKLGKVKPCTFDPVPSGNQGVEFSATSLEEEEPSQSVIAPRGANVQACLQCDSAEDDDEMFTTCNSSNNTSVDQTQHDAPCVSPKVGKNGPCALKNFVLATQDSAPRSEYLEPSPDREKDVASATRNQCYMKKVCQWLGLEQEELLYVLWRTSGDMNDAVNWILNGGTDDVPTWHPAHDLLLRSKNKNDQRQLKERFGLDGISKRINFLNINS